MSVTQERAVNAAVKFLENIGYGAINVTSVAEGTIEASDANEFILVEVILVGSPTMAEELPVSRKDGTGYDRLDRVIIIDIDGGKALLKHQIDAPDVRSLN